MTLVVNDIRRGVYAEGRCHVVAGILGIVADRCASNAVAAAGRNLRRSVTRVNFSNTGGFEGH